MSNKLVTFDRSGQPRVINKGYSHGGASHTKRNLKGFVVGSGSAHEDIDKNNYTLRQRSRILDICASLARSATATNRTNVIGVGLKLKSKIDREVLRLTAEQATAIQKKIEREFKLWAENKRACDATGVNDFYAMQQLAFRSYQTSGDSFALIKHYDSTFLNPYSLRLHIIEADRVRTPSMYCIGGFYPTEGINPETKNKIYDGVEIDGNGMIVAYHISNKYPNDCDFSAPEESIRVLAYGEKTGLPNILQIMDSERAEQYRGVPYLAPVIEPLLQLDRYTKAELDAADIEACFTGWVKTKSGTTENLFNEVGAGDVNGVPVAEQPVSRDPNEYEMGAGQINFLADDEDIIFSDPKRPASGFPAFVEAISKQIGAALEIPYELLLKSFNSSYSASRAAIIEAWKAFKMRRAWFVSDFCKPVYEIWLSEAVARGRIYAPGFFNSVEIRQAYLGSEWIGPAQGTLNPVQEIQAEVLAIQNGLTTRADAAIRLNGSEFSENASELEVENALLVKAGGIIDGKIEVDTKQQEEQDAE